MRIFKRSKVADLDSYARQMVRHHLGIYPLLKRAAPSDALVALVDGSTVIAVDETGSHRIFTDIDNDLRAFLSTNDDKDTTHLFKGKTTFFIVESDDAVINYRHRGVVWDPACYHEDLESGKVKPTITDDFGDTLEFHFNGRGVEMFPEGDIESFLFEKRHLETLELIVAKLKAEVGEQ